MQGVGALLALFAVWLGYCSLNSFRPLNMAKAILSDPSAIQSTITGAKSEALATVAVTAAVASPNTSSTNLSGSAATGSDTLPSGAPASTQVQSYQAYANQYGQQLFGTNWTPQQMQYLVKLWNMESGWNPNARNPSSGAAGIPQALGHTLPSNYATSPQAQIQWGLQYIKQRYGTPANAWAHEMSTNPHWY